MDEMICADERSSALLSATDLANTDDDRRLQQLKAAFMDCVRRQCPLVVHGPPGSGRTSMTAAVSQLCRSWLSSPHAVVAARVLASSPASMTIEYVLSTICYQLSEVRELLFTTFIIRTSLPVVATFCTVFETLNASFRTRQVLSLS